MNEIALSNDLNQIAEEIEFHSHRTQKSLWEIGRRLKHVKDNDLTHGQFMNWYQSIGLNKNFVSRAITISEEFSNFPPLGNISETALYLIATLPEEEQTEEIRKSEEGDPSTVRELQELKKELRRKETQLSLKEKRVQSLAKRNEDLEFKANQKPETIEKEVIKEVQIKPHDYDGLKSDNQQLSKALKEQQEENHKMRNQINQWQAEQGELDEKSKRYDELSQAIQDMEGRMDTQQKRIAAVKDITSKLKAGNQLIDELSGLIYLADYEEVSRNDFLSAEINKLLHRLTSFTNDLSNRLDHTTILEGEIIND